MFFTQFGIDDTFTEASKQEQLDALKSKVAANIANKLATPDQPDTKKKKKRKIISEEKLEIEDVEVNRKRKKKYKELIPDNETITSSRKKKKVSKTTETDEITNNVSGTVSVLANENAEVNSEIPVKRKRKKNVSKTATLEESETNANEIQDIAINSEEKAVSELQTVKDENNPLPESIKEEWTILGKKKSHIKLKTVKRDLPRWIANSHFVDPDFNNTVALENFPFLDKPVLDVLQKMEINSLFPIQAEIIPSILGGCQDVSLLTSGRIPPPDICVSAPTGSGKTLIYVLSLVQCLYKLPPMLQAIVIVPTKGLANQVKQVFNKFQKLIKVALLSGKDTFPSEQKRLYTADRHCLAHVAICTPGRLVNHLRDNSLFTLQHLRFLIVDEMDTLLNQSYQDWLPSLYKVVYGTPPTTAPPHTAPQPHCTTHRYPHGVTLSLTQLHTLSLPLQKLLFSATVTHDPGKLAPLHLYKPVLYSCGAGKYSLPTSLQQYQIRCTLQDKPLIIVHLARTLKRILCFTSAVDTAHRLALLAEEFGGIEVAEYSSTFTTQQRNKIVRDFALGYIDLLVCSDSLARGMDIAAVDHVVNYDVPAHVQTYVHRVGRTARAGRIGAAYTLIRHEETRHFHQILKKAGDVRAKDWDVPSNDLEELSGRYEESLKLLEKRLKTKLK